MRPKTRNIAASSNTNKVDNIPIKLVANSPSVSTSPFMCYFDHCCAAFRMGRTWKQPPAPAPAVHPMISTVFSFLSDYSVHSRWSGCFKSVRKLKPWEHWNLWLLDKCSDALCLSYVNMMETCLCRTCGHVCDTGIGLNVLRSLCVDLCEYCDARGCLFLPVLRGHVSTLRLASSMLTDYAVIVWFFGLTFGSADLQWKNVLFGCDQMKMIFFFLLKHYFEMLLHWTHSQRTCIFYWSCRIAERQSKKIKL